MITLYFHCILNSDAQIHLIFLDEVVNIPDTLNESNLHRGSIAPSVQVVQDKLQLPDENIFVKFSGLCFY